MSEIEHITGIRRPRFGQHASIHHRWDRLSVNDRIDIATRFRRYKRICREMGITPDAWEWMYDAIEDLRCEGIGK